MTDRKPDIITKWSIKENTDATYTAKCSTMPNVELTADNVVVILGKIEGFLKTMYRDTTVDGGITGINAEYNVTKRQEFSLDTFGTEDTKDTEMPTDDPTPEPATDAPELHEEPCIKPLAVPKKPRAKKQKKEEQPSETKCYLCKSFDTGKGDCSIGKDVCNNHCPNFDLIPEEERFKGFCGEAYEKPQPNGYKWKRITELVAGCAQCDRLSTGYCAGNKACEVCDNYHPRDDAGEECRTCKKLGGKLGYQQGGKDAYMCDCHKQPICLDDLSCYAYQER